MIKIENVSVSGWESAIRGMRNPLNSWDKSDSFWVADDNFNESTKHHSYRYLVGTNDLGLMKRLRKAGTDHRKYMRMIVVYCDILAPLYWWKEFSTYKVGTVANSCSTMHKIAAKEFSRNDFSCDHLISMAQGAYHNGELVESRALKYPCSPMDILDAIVEALNMFRNLYLQTKDKKYWWQMIQLLPSSYNQKRTVMLNYEVLANMYKSRKDHKLDEWHEFCDWIRELPYSELITGEDK